MHTNYHPEKQQRMQSIFAHFHDKGGGGGGSGGGGGEAASTVGTISAVTPSAVEASAAVDRLDERDICTAAVVVEAGTAMIAVMRTLAAATLIVTSDLSMPATVAIFCCKLEVSE